MDTNGYFLSPFSATFVAENGYFLSPFSATFVAVFGDELRILFVSVFGHFCRQCGQAFRLYKPSAIVPWSRRTTIIDGQPFRPTAKN